MAGKQRSQVAGATMNKGERLAQVVNAESRNWHDSIPFLDAIAFHQLSSAADDGSFGWDHSYSNFHAMYLLPSAHPESMPPRSGLPIRALLQQRDSFQS